MNEDQLEHLKNVSFKELTHEQKEEFKDYFSNEEEFENVKELFLGIHVLKSSKIEPGDQVKRNLDQKFEEKYKREGAFRTFFLFLFPPTRSFFMKPGFQIGIASIILIFGVYLWKSFETNKISDSNSVIIAENTDNSKLSKTKNENDLKNNLNDNLESKEELVVDQNTLTEEETTEVFIAETNPEPNNEFELTSLADASETILEEFDNSMIGLDLLAAESMDEENTPINNEEIHSLSQNMEVLDFLCATY